jgi:hypothetical protein
LDTHAGRPTSTAVPTLGASGPGGSHDFPARRPCYPIRQAGPPREGTSGAGRPVPLAGPPGRPDVVYGFGRIDASGWLADRATIATLGWRGGDRLTLTADAGVMIARRDPGGMVTAPSRPYIVIPAASARPIAGREAAYMVDNGLVGFIRRRVGESRVAYRCSIIALSAEPKDDGTVRFHRGLSYAVLLIWARSLSPLALRVCVRR